MSHWNVADVMTYGAVSVQQDTPFKEIVDILEAHRINAAPVIDDNECVIGLVSSADLLSKIEFAGDDDRIRLLEGPHTRQAREKAGATAAGDLMTSPAVTVRPGTSLVNAAKVMDSAELKRLPVVDDLGRPIGMLTRQDLLKVFMRSDAEICREIDDEVLQKLPGVDPSTIGVEVDNGVVTLLGEIDHAALIPAVVRRIERVDGVVDVVSQLSYDADERTTPVVRS